MLTDHCNVRCTYCMPEEGLQRKTKPDLLTNDDGVQAGLVRVAVQRQQQQQLAELLAHARAAARLGAHRPARRGPQPDSISLDTLRPDVFKTLNRRDRHEEVTGCLKAPRRPPDPAKIDSAARRWRDPPNRSVCAVQHDYELRSLDS